MTSPRRYGRTELSAYETSTEVLVLGGERFTKEDLQSVSSSQPMLVQTSLQAYARSDELAQLQAKVAKTLAQQTSRTVRLRRTPQRNAKKQWMLNGRRVAASEISLDENGQPFVPRTYASVEEALQQIVFELDGVRSGSSSGDISSSPSTLEN